jgi:phosphoribosylglycinamide formyltransferase-1
LAALLRALGDAAPARIVLVISNRPEAGGLAVARAQGIPTHLLNDIADPAEWLRVLAGAEADLVVLAGYLKRVPDRVVEAWRGRIINIHPALLPRHGGPGRYGHRVHEAVLAAGETVSGATVHLVTEEYDRGAILGQAEVPVLPGDTPEELAARVLAVEHRLLPAAVLAAAAAGRPVPFRLESDAAGSGAAPQLPSPLTP